ncbi:MAG: SDR family oxidoreductase [Methylophilaceae bacterium]|jgi:short-subunit dehydrogenase|nr:SDR family oxidoreductase [Methylophilaceae bacterium]
MNLTNKRILLTGATGGVGSIVAKLLVEKGAALALVGRDVRKLDSLKASIEKPENKVVTIQCDLSEENAPRHIAKCVQNSLGEIDILINNAGTLDFTALEAQSEDRIAEVINTNVTSLIQLTRHFLPLFQKKNSGHFLFVGSIFGSLGFPHYATYCASKFAVHGFSQALRRELVETKVGVSYIAPRGIKTPMNKANVVAMFKKTGNKMDLPERVAEIIVRSLEKEKQEVFIGQPQSFFAWLNGVTPKVVNIGLKKQAAIAKEFLK